MIKTQEEGGATGARFGRRGSKRHSKKRGGEHFDLQPREDYKLKVSTIVVVGWGEKGGDSRAQGGRQTTIKIGEGGKKNVPHPALGTGRGLGGVDGP